MCAYDLKYVKNIDRKKKTRKKHSKILTVIAFGWEDYGFWKSWFVVFLKCSIINMLVFTETLYTSFKQCISSDKLLEIFNLCLILLIPDKDNKWSELEFL